MLPDAVKLVGRVPVHGLTLDAYSSRPRCLFTDAQRMLPEAFVLRSCHGPFVERHALPGLHAPGRVAKLAGKEGSFRRPMHAPLVTQLIISQTPTGAG